MMRGFAVIAVVAIFSGCISSDSPPEATGAPLTAKTLLLRFTLTNTGDDRGASPGHHCGTVTFDDAKATVETEGGGAVATDPPLLLIAPKLQGPWASLGSSPFWKTVPYSVETGIYDETTKVGTVGWARAGQGGHATLDGTKIDLPYSWNVKDPQGKWSVAATLGPGPGKVAFKAQTMCA